jgi:hypothetical protein
MSKDEIRNLINEALSFGYHTAKDEAKGIQSAGYGTRFFDTYLIEQKLNIHGIMQAEGSDLSEGAAVGQRSVGTNAEARVNCAEGKHFWSINKGRQECLFCPARREAPSGGHL